MQGCTCCIKERFFLFHTFMSQLLDSDLQDNVKNIVLELVEHSIDESVFKTSMKDFEYWNGDSQYITENRFASVRNYGMWLFYVKFRGLTRLEQYFMFPCFTNNLMSLPTIASSDKEKLMAIIQYAYARIKIVDPATLDKAYEIEMSDDDDEECEDEITLH